jgi:molecular chaperone Hsp33
MSNKLDELKAKLKEGKSAGPSDHSISGLMHDGRLRVALVNLTESVQEAQTRHSLDPLTTIALGRALVSAALAGTTLKNQFEYINFSFQGDGPLRMINAEYVAPGSVRGFVGVPQLASVIGPEDPVPEFVGEALGQGTLTVRRALDGLAPYSGICKLQSGEIAEDVANYYLESEQLPTSLVAGTKLDKEGNVIAAAGLMIQKMGSLEEDDTILDTIESKLKEYMAISRHVSEGKTIEEIASAIFGEENGEMLSSSPLGFRCFCSRERMQMGLLKIDLAELKQVEKEEGQITTTCHYCGESYDFKSSEFEKH